MSSTSTETESEKALGPVVNESPSASPPPPEPKEGGLHSWLQVLSTLFILFNIWGLAFAFGSFQTFYTLNFLPTTSPSSSWLLIIGGLISGPLFDAGYYIPLIATGSFLSVFGIMMLSLSTAYYQILLSQGICTGLGFGLLYIPALTIVSRGFVKKRALAFGIATAGAPAGGVIYNLACI
ncbi:uncharacterized protein DSM5745_09932 [Aspergillus mulundensis]|uniref:Major facilitator superfamily (MFS) profile domain-containing protein n=1 Tax=Aspergillus mulundensis TaxID=1810919 RepID=A0A3D8QS51_9EURO|nr:hypothetical protein DSM5745_09932 [Aspergillus mulundensis]RDW64521.1 hypothetical protein DSM5745_09932 [Aspergillus mulundensis]